MFSDLLPTIGCGESSQKEANTEEAAQKEIAIPPCGYT